MQHVFFLIMRRMRTPLIVLISVYAISVLGFVLIPGLDPNGNPVQMDFFHAFYFVSFMGSTIGFGEIPYPFTGAQRLWTLFTIYATVVSWLYAIGTLISLAQTPAFKAAVTRNSFVKRVKKIKQPFYLICGYGDTGKLLVHALSNLGNYCVVVDKEHSRISELDLETLPYHVATLHADASDTETLRQAGLESSRCTAVVAVTRDGEVNLKIAVASKLLNPELTVYCWAETDDIGDNMASFGTDHVINPYRIFAQRLSSALDSPSQYLLEEWLSSSGQQNLCRPLLPPSGHWVLCGFGRFGSAVFETLTRHGMTVTVVESRPDLCFPPEGSVVGRGTEAITLQKAGIEKAVGIIAGTDHDVNNLSIIMTAKTVNPELFTIARQEYSSNRDIFDAANIDLVGNHSELIAGQLMARMTTPLTSTFIQLASGQTEKWAKSLTDRLAKQSGESNPSSWVISLTPQRASAVMNHFRSGGLLELRHLLMHPAKRRIKLACTALMIQRRSGELLLPEDKTPLHPHDRILFAGEEGSKQKIMHICASADVLHYMRTGENRPSGYFWNWVTTKFRPRNPEASAVDDS
ncbi:MAG: NAD-binding protein [Pseudomonadota bacterium]